MMPMILIIKVIRIPSHITLQHLYLIAEEKSFGDLNACDALDLVSLFHGLTLFDDQIERINVKDMYCQEFIDRIGKLYRPVAMAIQVTCFDKSFK